MCGKEYEENICPFCGYNPDEAEEMENEETKDVIEENIVQEISEDSLETAENLSLEETQKKVSDKKLKITAGILAFVFVILAGVFVYTKMIAPKRSENYIAGIIKSETEDTIKNAEKFTIKDLDGTFTDKVNHIYYTFISEKAIQQLKLGGESEEDASVDSAVDSGVDSEVDSSSEPKSETVTQTVEYDGTFTSGMTQAGIRQMVIINYIESNGLAEEYMDYIEKNNILSEDFEGFIKEKGYEDDLNAYDSDNNMSQSLSFEKTQGYFNFEEGTIVLFDENGTQSGEYIVTEKGLINTNYYYEGKMPSKGDLCAVYSMTMENYGMTQELYIRLYRDGYSVLEVGGTSPSFQAGTYKSDEKGVYININGQNIFFHVTDKGICNELLTK